jgi:hypothetical protein
MGIVVRKRATQPTGDPTGELADASKGAEEQHPKPVNREQERDVIHSEEREVIRPGERLGTTAGRLVFTRGATRLTMRGSEIDELCRISWDGGALDVAARDGEVVIDYPWLPALLGWTAEHMEIELNTELAWSIAVNGSLGDSSVDLRDLRLHGLAVTGAVYDTQLLLPVPEGRVGIRLGFGTGDVTLLHPPGAAVQLRITRGASGLVFDESQFEALVGNAYLETRAARAAADRYAIDLVHGANRVTVAEHDLAALAEGL